MSPLAFLCTLPQDWDPFCKGDQLLGLLIVGALFGAVAIRLVLRKAQHRLVHLIVLYSIGCLIGASLFAMVGIQLTNFG